MAAIHGKLARVKVSASVPTSSTNMAADLAVDKRTLLIDQTTRRHWDPSGSLLRVYGATTATPLAAGTYTPDYVRGRINFTTDHSTAVAYKVDVAWYQTSYLGNTRSYTINVNAETKDVTCFSSSTGLRWRSFIPSLNDATIQLGRLHYSSGAGSTAPVFIDYQSLQSPMYVELFPNASEGSKFECYAYIEGRGSNVPVDDLAAEDVTLKVTGPIYFTTST